jgi:purine-nucleoside phosphorylase
LPPIPPTSNSKELDRNMASGPLGEATEAAEALASLTGTARHDVAVILGTGLTTAAEALGEPRARLAFAQLPGFSQSTNAAQRPEVWSVAIGDHPVLVFLGRPHLYEGRTPAEVAHPVRTAVAAGCHTLVITNASGGLRPGLAPGDLVLISDHLNLTGASPLTGLPAGRDDPSAFVDLTDAWSVRLRELALKVDGSLAEGVYAQLRGPHFETPAEIRMLRGLGADLVGMSSVLEAIAARHLGTEVLGLSVVTNLAAGMAPGSVSPTSLVELARSRAPTLGGIVREVVTRL